MLSICEGVDKVVASLEEQNVSVDCDESVAPEDVLESIRKWATAGNKSISLA